MTVTKVDRSTGMNDRNSWTVYAPGQPGMTLASTEAEARAEAAKLTNPIVVPPQTQNGNTFTNASAPPAPVNLSPPPPPGAVTGVPEPDYGKMHATAEPIAGGMRVTVATRHRTAGDRMNYVLQVMLNGNFYAIKQLLAGEVVNPTSYSSQRTFDVRYSEIDKILADAGHPELKVTPGTTFAVLASFPSGHQFGPTTIGGSATEFPAPVPLPG